MPAGVPGIRHEPRAPGHRPGAGTIDPRDIGTFAGHADGDSNRKGEDTSVLPTFVGRTTVAVGVTVRVAAREDFARRGLGARRSRDVTEDSKT